MYVSIEFTDDGNYIVVEKDSAADKPVIHFGEYKIQDRETINLANLGIFKVKALDSTGINLTFTLDTGASKEEITHDAKKADPVASSAKTDLLCGTWKIHRLDGKAVSGTEDDLIMLFSKSGVFLMLYPDGTSKLRQWKWKDSAEDEFLYTWHNWERYGSAKIRRLTQTALEFEDPGYDADTFGYSIGTTNTVYALLPIYN
jgi:hypothetical protein